MKRVPVPIISRRGFMKSAGALSAAAGSALLLSSCGDKSGAPKAAAGKKPILIGMTSDASGQFANHGDSDRCGMLLAIDECNARGGVLGRKITHVHQDTASDPATGSSAAERLISQNEVSFLVGAVHSGVANAISSVAQKYGVVYLNTNSSSPSESGKDAHRVKFVWDGNGTNFARATIQYAMQSFGKNVLMLTHDYTWGHSVAKSTRALIEAHGGTVLKELLVPQNTRDFSAWLMQIQQSAPDLVAASIAGDDQKILRSQVVELKLDKRPAWINNQQDWPDVYGLPPGGLFGVFSTTWYHKLALPGVPEFVKRYREKFKDNRIGVPGNVSYNGYMATRELLRAIERAGSTNNIALIKELEKLRVPAAERMQHFDAYMNPKTHQLQQTIYLATSNPAPGDDSDLFKILSWAKPEDVADADAEKDAKLEAYDETPIYEP